MRFKFSFIIFFAALMAFDSAWAQRARPFFQSSRALSMGDAMTAHDVGYEGVYYNPASVARPKEIQIKYIDLEATIGHDSVAFFTQTASSLGQMSKIIENISNTPGKHYGAGAALLPQFLAKNISFGLIGRNFADAYVDPDNLNLHFYSYSDLGAHLTLGFALFGGIVKFGAGGRALQRAELNRIYSQQEYTDQGLDFSTQWQEGTGYGLDLGLLLTAPIMGLPRIGIAVTDVGDTKLTENHMLFTPESSTPGAPANIKQRINVGGGLVLKHGRGIKSFFGTELKDIETARKARMADYFHAGWELDVKRILFLRAGINQGQYWTAGAGLHMGGMGFEFASYGENITHVEGSRVSDRKYVGRYVLQF